MARIWIGRCYIGCAWGDPPAWGFKWMRHKTRGGRMLTLSVWRVAFGVGIAET